MPLPNYSVKKVSEKRALSALVSTGIVAVAIIGLVVGYTFLEVAPGVRSTTTATTTNIETVAGSAQTITNTRTQAVTATVTQAVTSTTTQTQTITSTASIGTTSSSAGRPPLYPLDLIITVYCSGFVGGCQYQGQAKEASGAAYDINEQVNFSLSVPAFYEGGCGPTGPCSVLLDWTVYLVNTGGGDYLNVLGIINGQVVSNQTGTSITGSACEAYCS